MQAYDREQQAKQIRAKKLKRKQMAVRARRIRIVGVILSMCLAALLVQVWSIKYVHGQEYERRALAQQIDGGFEKITKPNRGAIYDRNAQSTFAVSTKYYRVILDIRTLFKQSEESREKAVTAMNELLGIPVGELNALLKPSAEDPKKPEKDTQYYKLVPEISAELAAKIREKRILCVSLEEDYKRNYLYNNLAANVIGFIRGDSKWGLELQYDAEMTGESGREFKVYENDGYTSSIRNPAVDGYSLITTLDASIQQFAENTVLKAAERYDPPNAAVIVMKPMTGEILAMAQYPNFNVNVPDDITYYSDKSFPTNWESMTETERLNAKFSVWTNFCISSSFEPGSIFKPVVIAAALEENIIDPSRTYYCGGSKTVLTTSISCWKKAGHGTQTLMDVLGNSCNVAMMEIIQELGKEKFYKYRCDFGYGEKTGIDLPGETPVSSPVVMYPLSALNPVEMATSSMGQGFNNTAIQAVNSIAAVINGGNLMKPYVVSQVIDAQGNVVKENKPVVQKKVISKETSEWMKTALLSVMTPTKTGKSVAIEGYEIGGKTGTAEQSVRGSELFSLSCVAYLATDNNPEILVGVFIDRLTTKLESSQTVAPLTRELLQDIITYKGMKPTTGAEAVLSKASGTKSFPLPDFTGMSIQEAIRRINKLNLDYEVNGPGDVVNRQFPGAEKQMMSGDKVHLYGARSSEGVELVTIPNVTGMPVEQAIDMLSQAGFVPVIEDNSERANDTGSSAGPFTGYGTESSDNWVSADKKVYQQMPSYDNKVPKSTEIKIKVK